MKKYLALFSIFVLAFVLSVQFVQAEDNNTGQTNNDTGEISNSEQNGSPSDFQNRIKDMEDRIDTIRNDAKDKMDVLKNEIENIKDAAKAKMQELIISGRENALNRFDNAIGRITDQETKVNTAINTLSAKGVDVSAAKAFIQTADTALTDAKLKTANAHTILSTSINQLTTDQKNNLRTLTKDIQTSINNAHQALKDAVKSLKEEAKLKLDSAKVETSSNTSNTTENNNQQ